MYKLFYEAVVYEKGTKTVEGLLNEVRQYHGIYQEKRQRLDCSHNKGKKRKF